MQIKKKAKTKNKTQEKVGLQFDTPNNNGIFEKTVNAKGKEVNVLSWENVKIIHGRTGTIISDDITPKFKDWTYTDYLEKFHKDMSVRWLEPMGSQEDKTYLDRKANDPLEIAELKKDGHRAIMFMGKEANRFFSRNVSKKTDWWGENSDQIPHLRDLVMEEYEGTVLDGEVDYGTDSMHVQSVMGALPANAIQYQFENGLISFFAFDILYYKGVNVQAMPLWKRKIYLKEVVDAFIKKYYACHIEFLPIYATKESYELLEKQWIEYYGSNDIAGIPDDAITIVDNFRDLFIEVVAAGYEGLIIKNIYADYIQGKKNKNWFLKLKKNDTWDVIITGLTEPTKVYDGKELKTWKYWETPDGSLVKDENVRNEVAKTYIQQGYTPVTKPYFMGWCGGITCAVIKPFAEEDYEEIEMHEDQAIDEGLITYTKESIAWIMEVATVKGISEEVAEDLRLNWKQYVEDKRVLEILGQNIIDKETGSIRHPRFLRWRDDKHWEMCTFASHIREEE